MQPKEDSGLAAAWERWAAAAKEKMPTTRRRGPRMVLTPEARELHRAEYLIGYYGKKVAYFTARRDELRRRLEGAG